MPRKRKRERPGILPEDKELVELIDRAADLNGEGAFVRR